MTGLLGGRREAHYYLWRVGVDVDGALREVTAAQVALYAAAPGTDEREIEGSADYGAGDWYQPSDPFFGGFLSEF